MKKSVFLLLIALIIFACQREEMGNVKNEYVIYNLDNVLSMNNNKTNEIDIDTLLTNPDDSDDEKINNYLYQLTLAIRDLITNSEFNSVIISMASESETQTANLLELETIAPEFYFEINENLSEKGLSLQQIANDLTHAPVYPNPDYPSTYVVEQYVPAIFIPNISSVNEALQPLISPGIELDANENEEYEDNIFAWYFTESGELEMTFLSEELAMGTSNPIFILDNAVTSLETEIQFDATPKNLERNVELGLLTSGDLSFSSYEHSIESQQYRYENWSSGKSEFAINMCRIDENGTIQSLNQYMGWKSGTKVISEILKNDIGSIKYTWSHHADNWQPWSNPWTPNVIQNGLNMVFWNTFERDWNHSLKPLGTATANGKTIYLVGNMKYISEWYAWDPGTVQVHYTRFSWIYDDWAHWNNSYKSKFRIWRVGS